MDLNALITRIVNLQQELAGYLPLRMDVQEKLDKKFRLEFNYNSNHIEGNTLTYGETELYLIFDKTTGNHDGREYEEMRASDVALKMIQEYAAEKERPLTEAFIKSLNELILVRPYWVDAMTPSGQSTRRQIIPGGYKKQPNSVRLQNGEMFHYTSPEETPIQMGELVEWYRAEIEKNELHPVALAALLHYRFVRIHPFDDGNGRISRLLMNYVLYANDLPPVVVKSADKKNYLFALNQADAGDINAFVEYIARQLVWSLELSIKAAKGENIEEQDDLEKEIEVWKKGLKHEPITPQKKIFSAPVLNELFFTQLYNFLQFLETKVHIFKDVFQLWEQRGSVIANQRATVNNLGKSFFNEFFNQNFTEGISPNNTAIDKISSIGIIYLMQNIVEHNKSIPTRMTVSVQITFLREEYVIGYQVTATAIPTVEKEFLKKYDDKFSEEEQQVLSKDILNEVFKNIKTLSGTSI